ncbi:MAG TPA: xanthine dehydrogenase family protein molybdopterin-binding subunit [Anaerolineales bacterium]|nr:xanthine dehydrogenase family protein molybdopterin-binding subunit [Anaerolineales bacterium]
MTEFKTVGRPTPLIDGRAKVTGATHYASDLQLPGMLHARLVTSLHAHANLRGIEVEGALAVSGVVTVLTAKEMPDIAPSSRGHLLLARGRVIFAGQPVAVVLATSEAAAEDGAQQVVVDYEPLPAAITIDEALAENAPLVWPQGVPTGAGDAGVHGADIGSDAKSKRKASNVAGQESFVRGDVAAGFAEADVVIEGTFTTPMVHQSAVETQSVVAEPKPSTGGITLWASTQSPFGARNEVANVLGIPESDVRVVGMAVGGGFGGKNGLYEPLVAAAAHAVGRPVRLVLTRMEEMLAANPAPPARIHLRLGAKRDGTLTALSSEIFLDNGCYPFDLGGFLGYMLGSFYRAPNFSIHGTDVLTFKVSAGAYRAPGAPSVIFALDSLMDELAERLHIDPIELRLRNAARPGDPMADGKPWPSIGMRDVLEALRDHPAWKQREEARARGRGVGVAVGGWPGGTEPAAAACNLNRDGILQVNVGSVDLNGTTTGFALMAAEVFGVAPDQVRVVFSDTDTAPYSGASAGSKVTYTTGAAVVQAAREAKQQVLSIAAEELEVAVEDLEIVDGAVRVRGVPGRAIKLGDIASKAMRFGGRYAPVFAQGRVAQTATAPAFNAQLAEVGVDRETGEVRLHRLIIVQDVGRAINPLAIEGQMMGGATQGIGWALYEKMEYDAQGQLLTGSWMDYAVPNIIQTPAMEAVIVEVPSEYGPFGARGVGEAPVVPTAAAIANAIADATGIRLRDLPMTAPRVLEALKHVSD